jgi:hypothetical protein
MKTRAIHVLFLSLIAGAQFFISNEFLQGYLRSEVTLAREIKTPLDSIDQYLIADEAPFKYRILFPAIVKGTFDVIYERGDETGFYYTYKFWSLLFYITSTCSFFLLLNFCGFTEQQSFAGSIIFLLLPPMLMAYTLPVHTREDTLAYTLLFVGLILMLSHRRWLFLALCIIAVTARETLLLLPLLYFFYGKDEVLARKALISLLPPVLWVGMRIIPGVENYDVWEGFRWNMDNPEQVVGFAFITFNFLWLSFLLHFAFYKRNMHFIGSDLRFFYRSSLFVFVVVMVTTFVGGIFNEIRLLYLLAPWMIVLFLDCYRNYRDLFRMTAGTRNYRLFAAASLVFCVAALYLLLRNRENLIVPGKYAVPYDQWIIFSVCYILVFLLFVPHLFTIFSLKRSAK